MKQSWFPARDGLDCGLCLKAPTVSFVPSGRPHHTCRCREVASRVLTSEVPPPLFLWLNFL